ncbi:MAG: GNAT family N-acetyltransferase [bacterium]
MTEADFPDCQRLREQAGWNQTLTDWRRFLSFNPTGCFVAVLGERVVGTVCTIPYEDCFGWVAMVIVDREHRREGIGRALLLMGIEHLESRGLTVKLDATPQGKQLYDTLGFQDEYGAARYERHAESLPGEASRAERLRVADLDQLNEWDRMIFGASRMPVMQSYMEFFPEFAFCLREKGALRGYIMGREGTHAFHIGPWVADDPKSARRLLDTLLDFRKPERIFVDIVHPNPHATVLLESRGFRQQRPFIRMFRGVNRHPGTPERVYGMSGPELG